MYYRVAWLLCSMLSLTLARENPFAIAMDPASVGKTTQIKEQRSEFNSTQISLPSSARILKSASVTFQNLDGSISEEIVAIEQDVDWHYPLVLLPQKPKPQEPTTTQAPIVVQSPKAEPKKEVSVNTLETPTKGIVVKSFTRVVLNETIEFEISDNRIMIYTKDKKIRDFLISQPYKVVVDFEKSQGSFTTKTAEFSKAPFVSATLGNHDGFYRIAIVLDGHYRYDIAPIDGGYVITLK